MKGCCLRCMCIIDWVEKGVVAVFVQNLVFVGTFFCAFVYGLDGFD